MTMDSRKVRVDTSAIDGLRGFAVFHIILGHLFLYSNFRELSFKNLFGSPELVWDGPCPKGWLRLKDRCYGGECDTAFRDEAERACQKMVEGVLVSNGPAFYFYFCFKPDGYGLNMF